MVEVKPLLLFYDVSLHVLNISVDWQLSKVAVDLILLEVRGLFR